MSHLAVFIFLQRFFPLIINHTIIRPTTAVGRVPLVTEIDTFPTAGRGYIIDIIMITLMIILLVVVKNPLLIILVISTRLARYVQMTGSGGPGTVNFGPRLRPQVMVATRTNTPHVGAPVREATVTVKALEAIMPVLPMQ